MSVVVAGYIGVCDVCHHLADRSRGTEEEAWDDGEQCAADGCEWCSECGNG